MAQAVGYNVVVIDPVPYFGSRTMVLCKRVSDFPEDLTTRYWGSRCGGHTSPNPIFDDEALYLALGERILRWCIGGRKNHAKRCARLQNVDSVQLRWH